MNTQSTSPPNPFDDFERQHRALTILEILRQTTSGKTVQQACQEAGISTATYYRWRQDGAIQEALAQRAREVETHIHRELLAAWVAIIEKVLLIAQGISPDGTMPVYPRDMIAAYDRLKPIFDKILATAPKAYGEERKFLEDHGIGWMPIQRSGKVEVPVEDGDELTLTLRRGQPDCIDVTPNEGD